MNRRKIKELIELVETSGISELEVHFFGGRKVVIRKHSSGTVPVQFPVEASSAPITASAPIPQPAAKPQQETISQSPEPAQEQKEKEEDKYIEIKSPMVGTFYRKPSPDSKPYIEVGEHISKGQVVCLIEAMKLFNEVKAEISGKLVKIVVEDGSPVEFGQTLLLLEPE